MFSVDVKGALYCLLGNPIGVCLANLHDWECIALTWPAIVRSGLSSAMSLEKPSIVRLFDDLADKIHRHYETIGIDFSVRKTLLSDDYRMIVIRDRLIGLIPLKLIIILLDYQYIWCLTLRHGKKHFCSIFYWYNFYPFRSPVNAVLWLNSLWLLEVLIQRNLCFQRKKWQRVWGGNNWRTLSLSSKFKLSSSLEQGTSSLSNIFWKKIA